MDGLADLHVHTTYSDGTLSPKELLEKANGVGLKIVSITDHDTVDALEEAIPLGQPLGIEVIPGVELSASYDGFEVHILGYFVDYRNKNLLDVLAAFREERLRRAVRIVDKLNQMNIPLTLESVLANTSGVSVGRPHIATALVSEGHAETYNQAFRKYIGDGKPAYESKVHFSPEETIRIIADSGGLSFLAHPGHAFAEDVLSKLIDAGLDGIEVVHPSHSPELVRYYRGIVSEYYLLESGGSDFHGGQRGDDPLLGQVGVPVSVVDVMRHRLFSN